MAVVLGLAVAIAYGAADFLGGLSAKRSPVTSVVVLSQVLGLPVLLVLVPVTGGEPTARALALGAAAGVAGGIGLTCLYRGLAIGRMGVVAPITAVGAAVIPVVWALAQGERPSGPARAGILLALVGVALVSRAADGAGTDGRTGVAARAVGLAVVAGIGFGGVFTFLAEVGDGVGLWPLVATRTASIALLTAAALVSRQPLRPADRAAMRTIVGAGVLDMTANILYLLATRHGLLALVAVLSSLYPAATVVLARVVVGERMGRLQLGGVVLAAGGIVLMAAG